MPWRTAYSLRTPIAAAILDSGHDLQQTALQQRQYRLRLRVAKAAVVLDHLRSVRSEHEAEGYTAEVAERCMQEIFLPTIRAMQAEGRTICGMTCEDLETKCFGTIERMIYEDAAENLPDNQNLAKGSYGLWQSLISAALWASPFTPEKAGEKSAAGCGGRLYRGKTGIHRSVEGDEAFASLLCPV